eukprot:m.124535 g.124535  ORF g.124535 m.124535 type:complete len:72 (+) comp52185_c0_seq2:606-821(+)
MASKNTDLQAMVLTILFRQALLQSLHLCSHDLQLLLMGLHEMLLSAQLDLSLRVHGLDDGLLVRNRLGLVG